MTDGRTQPALAHGPRRRRPAIRLPTPYYPDGCRSLLSHDPQGIEIQTYCAIIACMLIGLWTGRKPTLRTYEMICYYLTGMAEEDELLAHLVKLQAHAG
jgi:hypothetical protein